MRNIDIKTARRAAELIKQSVTDIEIRRVTAFLAGKRAKSMGYARVNPLTYCDAEFFQGYDLTQTEPTSQVEKLMNPPSHSG